MIALWNALVAVALAAASPALLVWLALSPRARAGAVERLTPLPRRDAPTLWLHAASVGEVEAAVPLLSRLLEEGIPVLATTLTVTGRTRLAQRFPGLGARLAPLDLPGLVHVSVRRARVAALVLVETELWPNAILATARAGGRVVIASARLSDRSFPRYRALRAFFSRVLSARAVHAIAAQTERDARRFEALGAPPERTRVVGDLKLDRPAAPQPTPELTAAIGPGPLLVGGSTHAGEEEALLGAWQELRTGPAPELRLVLAPRHADRADDVLVVARRFGAAAALRSRGAASADVVVVDSVGELGSLYRMADLVFVGGSLARIGGHNLVEAVQAGKVVVHGPHVENQRAQVDLLGPRGVLLALGSARELAPTLERLWLRADRHAPARAAGEWLAAQRGATERVLACVREAFSQGARDA